jgi:hypothetical protein
VAFSVARDGHSYGWTDGAVHSLGSGVVIATPAGQSLTLYPDGTTTSGLFELRSSKRMIQMRVDAETGDVFPVSA